MRRPVDPGYTIAEAAQLLRITRAYVAVLLSRHAELMRPARYQRLRSRHPRRYRILYTRDVEMLQHELFVNAVKRKVKASDIRLIADFQTEVLQHTSNGQEKT